LTDVQKLEGFQTAKESLKNIMGDQAKAAIWDIRSTDYTPENINYRYSKEYYTKYWEAYKYFSSDAFREARVLSDQLKEEIIRCHKNEIINEASFTKHGHLMTTKSQFPEPYKKHDYQWNMLIIRNKPLGHFSTP
jgi:hypothetical protein